MPIYEYRCQQCDHQLELIQKINDPHATDCPACGESALKKKVSAAAFRLKGAGWYETDFKSGDKKKNLVDSKSDNGSSSDSSSGESKTSASDSGQSAASKADSKPASESKSAPSASATKKD